LKKGFIYLALTIVLVTGVSLGVRSWTTDTPTKTTVVTTPSDLTSISTTSINSPTNDVAIKAQSFKVENIRTTNSSIVLFNVPVMEESVDIAIAMLQATSSKTVYLVLSSPGGSVLAGARLGEYIKNSGKNIITVCDNLCASMAFQLFEMGSRRLMTEKAILMAHPASGGAQGTIENMLELIKMYKLYVDRMDADVAKRSGIEYNKFKRMVSDNIWVETPEALALGLADGVVHLEVIGGFDTFGTDLSQNVMDRLKKTKKWNDDMLKVRGYILDIK
jgi:ATP-dependent protease ClpP protease subunit